MKNIWLISILALLISSCDSWEKSPPSKNTINIFFEYHDSITKSTQPVLEGEISSLSILLYDQNGKLSYGHHYEEGTSGVSLEISAEKGYSIYAIANSGDITKESGITDESVIRGLYSSFGETGSIVNSDGTVPMSGHIPLRSFSDQESISISLTRLLSKFRIILDKSGLDPTVKKFEIKEIRTRNINRKVHYFSNSKATSSEEITDIGNSYTGKELDLIFTTGVDFYIPENMQGDLLSENIDQRSHIPPEPYNDLCTYVEILVNYLSEMGYDDELTYRYYIHDGRLLDNFDVERNKMYTCTTTFYGSGINEQTWRVEKSSLKKLVTGIAITPDSYTFTSLGTKIRLKTTITPSDAEDNTVSWSSSNPDIAKVDNYGGVSSVSNGTCTITATANDISGVKGTAQITVKSRIYPSSITVSPTSASLYVGETTTITATVSPSDADNKSVRWSSSNTSVATVSSGVVTAVGPGNCSIYASTAVNGITAETQISVKEKSFTLNDIPVLYPNYNSPFYITHTADPTGTPSYRLTKVSGEESLVISSNVLTPYYSGSQASGIVGSYTLSGTMNGITREKEVYVNIGSISVSTPSSLVAGEYGQGVILSKSPSDVGVTWSSSDPSIASIDNNGIISAHKGGSVTIKAQCSTGAYSTSVLNVTEPYIEITVSNDKLLNSNISGTSVSGYATSASISVNSNISPSIEWEVFDKDGDKILLSSIFTISSSGTITPINNASGTYYLRGRSGDICSNQVTLKVYLYLEYELEIYLHSYDITKEEITYDYQVESRWNTASWEALNRNYNWVYNFHSRSGYDIIKVDNEFGYTFISDSYNSYSAISSVFYNSMENDGSYDSYTKQDIINSISVTCYLRDLSGGTARGKKGIAIEDESYGYFYVKEG